MSKETEDARLVLLDTSFKDEFVGPAGELVDVLKKAEIIKAKGSLTPAEIREVATLLGEGDNYPFRKKDSRALTRYLTKLTEKGIIGARGKLVGSGKTKLRRTSYYWTGKIK